MNQSFFFSILWSKWIGWRSSKKRTVEPNLAKGDNGQVKKKLGKILLGMERRQARTYCLNLGELWTEEFSVLWFLLPVQACPLVAFHSVEFVWVLNIS
jgi:hypothetical protein